MEFKITEAEVREMAEFEEEVGCDISAGADWGIHLDKVIEIALNPVDLGEPMLRDREKFIDLLKEQFGNVISPSEIEEIASSFQMQIQEWLASKLRD
ncbi:MAG: hypothetical protein HC778_03445 [Chamaesiphon sp. CSU_1_12]|nr:hypothetical protein [Chamaesiphon sp. CSU_1_12]